MKYSAQKTKFIIFLAMLLAISGFFAASFQKNILRVKADSLPLIVETSSLDFGIVFPSENLQKTFAVKLANDYGYEVNYRIAHYPKPREDGNRQYCREHPSDYEKCYPDLCKFINESSLDDPPESDTAESAHLTPKSDTLDSWAVNLTVPPIAGFVGQDYQGQAVAQADTYGCDLSVELLESISGEIEPGGSGNGNGNRGNDGGSGGVSIGGLEIYGETASGITNNSVTIIWNTSKKSTSRVIFSSGDESHSFNPDYPPNYGYLHSTDEIDAPAAEKGKTGSHTVVISGLLPGTVYYFRCISHASPPTISREYTFTTLAATTGKIGETGPKPEDGFVGGTEISSIIEKISEMAAETANKIAKYDAAPGASENKQPLSKSGETSVSGENNEGYSPNSESLKDETQENKEQSEAGSSDGKFGFGFMAGAILPALKFISSSIFEILLLFALIALCLLFYNKKKKKDEKKT